MCDELFPDAARILDYYHLKENLFTFAKFYFNNDESKYVPWADTRADLRWDGKVDEVLLD
jgi:hypothetical protein